MNRRECGGCAQKGSHIRFCPVTSGQHASDLYVASEMIGAVADRVGSSDPGLANGCYVLASDTLATARKAEEHFKAATKPRNH